MAAARADATGVPPRGHHEQITIPGQRSVTLAGLDEQMLVESPTLRSQFVGRTDVLDKVGALAFLPDGVHATSEMVADYYEIPVKTITSVITRNRVELETNGLHVLKGDDLRELKVRFKTHLTSKVLQSPQLTLWTRKAILNAGQLLTESEVAVQVRRYLLTVEQTATIDHRVQAYRLIRFQERADYQSVLHCLKLGGAVSEDYRLIQNTLYVGLFGRTAAQIRATWLQVDGERKRDGSFTAASSKIAKNYLPEAELKLLDHTVVTINAQLGIRHPDGATADQMLAVVNASVALMRPLAIGAAA